MRKILPVLILILCMLPVFPAAMAAGVSTEGDWDYALVGTDAAEVVA